MTMTLDAQPTLYTKAVAALVEHGDEPEPSGLVDTLEAHCPICDQPSLLITHDEGQQNAVFVYCSPTHGAGCALEAIYDAIDIPRPGEAYREGFTDDPLDARTISEVIGATKEDEQMAQYTAEQLIERGRAADETPHEPPTPRDTGATREWEKSETWQKDVGYAEWQLTVKEEARTRHEARKAAGLTIPQVVGLAAFLAVEDQDAKFCILDLFPVGGNVVLAAPYKAGKSTIVGNLIRAFADGGLFLGKFETEQRKVVLIDNELDARTLRRWFRDQGITNTENVRLVSLRGRTATFNILEEATRKTWADLLRWADVIIFDCLRPVLDALGLDENKDGGKFFVAFDALKADAGISEGVVIHHMGHNGERARGDSRINDWPDVTWKIIREKPDDPSSSRYFSAFGRDVDVSEARLLYDTVTRHLMLEGGSRKDAARDDALMDVLAYLRTIDQTEGVSSKTLETALIDNTGHGRAAIRAAVKVGKERSLIMTHAGAHGAYMHRLNPLSSPPRHTSPPARQQGQNDLASAPIGRGEEDDRNNVLATDETGEVKCDICRQPLHPIHTHSGYTTCPSCEMKKRDDQ